EAGPAAMIAPVAPGIGGHITALGHEPYRYTTFYVDVEDVAAYLKKAESLGGKTLVPPIEIPTGTFAWMQDLGQHHRPVEIPELMRAGPRFVCAGGCRRRLGLLFAS